MCQKRRTYNQNNSQVNYSLGVVIPEAVVPAPIVSDAGVNRVANGGAANPSSTSVQQLGNPRIVPNSANGVIDNVTNTISFDNVPLAGDGTVIAGASIDEEIFAGILQTGGSDPVPGAPVSSRIRYLDTFGAVQTLAANLVILGPGGIYQARLKVDMAGNLPGDFESLLDFSITYNINTGAVVSYSYYLTGTVADPLPAIVQFRYTVAPGPPATETQSIFFDGSNRLLGTFPVASDPIAAYGGVAEIEAVYSGQDSLPGWIYKFDRPFVLLALPQVYNAGSNASEQMLLNSNASQELAADLLYQMKRAFNYANKVGLKEIPANDFVSLFAGNFDEYWSRFIKGDMAASGAMNGEVTVQVMGEMIMGNYWLREYSNAGMIDIPKLLGIVSDLKKIGLAPEYFGSPGSYFVPNDDLTGGFNPFYWPVFDAYKDLFDAPNFLVLFMDVTG